MIITTTASVVAVPFAASLFSTIAIFAMDKINQPPLSSLDLRDTAGWHTSSEWLIGAPIEHEYKPVRDQSNSPVSVAIHNGGRWRTLQRYGTVQSVTRWDNEGNKPLHHAVGNEYIKVMASAYAALQTDYPLDEDADETTPNGDTHEEDDGINSHMHLGIGGGTLPMLLSHTRSPVSAIDIDPDVVTLATRHLGFNHDSHISVHVADALRHRDVVESTHSGIFVDIAGDDNNIPSAFVSRSFVEGVHEKLDEGGVVVANFHRGNAAENARVEEGKRMYSEVFGSCFVVTSRFQGNVVIAAVKDSGLGGGVVRFNDGKEGTLDIEKAKRVALRKGWRFDPESRLRGVKYVRSAERIVGAWG